MFMVVVMGVLLLLFSFLDLHITLSHVNIEQRGDRYKSLLTLENSSTRLDCLKGFNDIFQLIVLD